MWKFFRRNAPVLAAAVVASALTAATPVIAHGVRHALFAHNADKLDGKSSGAFVGDNGVIRVTGSAANWESQFGGTPFHELRWGFGYGEVSEGQTKYMTLMPETPTASYGQDLKLTAVEICYELASGPQIDLVTVYTYHHSDEMLMADGLVTQVQDSTDRGAADSGCRMYRLPSPERLSREEGVGVDMEIKGGPGSAQYYLGRTTVFLQPIS